MALLIRSRLTVFIYSLSPGYAFCRAFGNLSYWLRRLCSKRKHDQPPFRLISRFLFCCRCFLKCRADSWKSHVVRHLRFVLRTPIFWLVHQKCGYQAVFYQFHRPADIGKYLFYFLHKSLHIIRVSVENGFIFENIGIIFNVRIYLFLNVGVLRVKLIVFGYFCCRKVLVCHFIQYTGFYVVIKALCTFLIYVQNCGTIRL